MSISAALNEALGASLKSVSKDWTELKRHADRQQRVRQRDFARFRVRPHEVTVKGAAYSVMEQAYLKASSNGRLPANARQIMYAARPLILEMSGGKIWKNDSYFTQTLLPDFVKLHPGQCSAWDVVFDARGHLKEPHTNHEIGLGTLHVRSYRNGWHAAKTDVPTAESLLNGLSQLMTRGPGHRYGAVLFLEKEGFNELLQHERFAERFDLAIMSTKGMSVTAARALVTELSEAGVTTYVLHDFDKAGFSIVHTLRSSTRRHQFYARPKVVDLGLRLTDVEEMGLDPEPVDYEGRIDPRINLRESGATQAECDYLVEIGGGYGGWTGQRVELNEMDSEQFIEWLEQKLVDAGVKKLIPDDSMLADVYRRARQIARMREQLRALESVTPSAESDPVPQDLLKQVEDYLATHPEIPWDVAVWGLAAEVES